MAATHIGVSTAHHHEGGDARRNLDLDLDRARFEAEEGDGGDMRDHQRRAGAIVSTNGVTARLPPWPAGSTARRPLSSSWLAVARRPPQMTAR